MTKSLSRSAYPIDVAVIGGGPAGLGAATQLKRLGVERVVVLDREPEAGGIPRHCGHPPFGMREFKRFLTGPVYARKLVTTALAAGVELHLSTTVVEARPNGHLLITSNNGLEEISAKRVLYATGVRETPRSARLISGARTQGVLNTGALQSLIYLKNRRPFERPVIIGSELVSFSAIQTCRHANIKPVAIIEPSNKVTARWPTQLFAPLVRVPLHLNTKLISIEGSSRVEAIKVETSSGKKRQIECDGVILTGQFIPESTLARCGHLALDPATGGPLVDQFGRCSDPVFFAAGNLLRAVETAGWSWNEGRACANWINDDLQDKLPSPDKTLTITTSGNLIKYCMPQKISLPSSSLPNSSIGMKNLQLRFLRRAKGDLIVRNQLGEAIKTIRLRAHPERRVLVRIKDLVSGCDGGSLELSFDEQ